MLEQLESLNRHLFLLINAGGDAATGTIVFAGFWAQWLIWAVPAGLVLAWLRAESRTRQSLMLVALSGVVGLLINQLISLMWYHPRPFEIGLGHTYLAHAADSSFPSDHLTLYWSVTIAWLRLRGGKWAWGMVWLGLPLAWARIYLGVHYPLDMVGAALVSVGSAQVALRSGERVIGPLLPLLEASYRRLCAPAIRRGWFLE
jgi:undecaprenyl-diphosphatase